MRRERGFIVLCKRFIGLCKRFHCPECRGVPAAAWGTRGGREGRKEGGREAVLPVRSKRRRKNKIKEETI
jgi:hypothetical protein